MMNRVAALVILVLGSGAIAAPSNIPPRDIIHNQGTALGGAIDIANYWASWSATATGTATATGIPPVLSTPTPGPSLDARNGLSPRAADITIVISNRAGEDLTTAHASNAGSPTQVGGATTLGALPSGSIASIVVPSGWAGNIAFVGHNGKIIGDESLIEASYVTQGGSQPVFDIDVSYVNGFSQPITCSCDVGVIAGCNLWLWGLNSCPNDNGVGGCINPERAGNSATAFFAPCQHAAYAYASDNAANTGNGVCHTNTISCCVGTSCPTNPRQPVQ